MILVDYREDSETKGSHGLWDDLKQTSLPIEQSSLEGGDLMFLGNGPEGKQVTVGVEFKKVRDLISSIRTKRLQGVQIPKLMQYDYRYLLVEGEWRHDARGRVVLRKGWAGGEWSPAPGGMSAAELDKVLLGLPLRCGIIVQSVSTRKDTVRWIQSLYRNFTDVAWEEHRSHQGIYRPTPAIPVSDFRTFIMGIPGIGVKTSLCVEQFFTRGGKVSPRRAIAARAATWQKIEGIGSKGAQSIDSFLEGE
jgi:ERCC4-type nuclease